MAAPALSPLLSRRALVAGAVVAGGFAARFARPAAPSVDLDAYLGLLAEEFRAAMAEHYPDHPLARALVWTAPAPAPTLAGDAQARRLRVVAALT